MPDGSDRYEDQIDATLRLAHAIRRANRNSAISRRITNEVVAITTRNAMRMDAFFAAQEADRRKDELEIRAVWEAERLRLASEYAALQQSLTKAVEPLRKGEITMRVAIGERAAASIKPVHAPVAAEARLAIIKAPEQLAAQPVAAPAATAIPASSQSAAPVTMRKQAANANTSMRAAAVAAFQAQAQAQARLGAPFMIPVQPVFGMGWAAPAVVPSAPAQAAELIASVAAPVAPVASQNYARITPSSLMLTPLGVEIANTARKVGQFVPASRLANAPAMEAALQYKPYQKRALVAAGLVVEPVPSRMASSPARGAMPSYDLLFRSAPAQSAGLPSKSAFGRLFNRLGVVVAGAARGLSRPSGVLRPTMARSASYYPAAPGIRT